MLLNTRFGQSINGGGTLFRLQDPIVSPSARYVLTLGLPFAAMPLSLYEILGYNRALCISYIHAVPPESSSIEFPMGCHNIDEIFDVLNHHLLFGFTSAYFETQIR